MNSARFLLQGNILLSKELVLIIPKTANKSNTLQGIFSCIFQLLLYIFNMKRMGKKYTSTHTTIIDASASLVDFAHDHMLVTKITLGIIKPIPSSKGNLIKRIKCAQEPACLFVKVRGNRAIQELRLFSSNVSQFEKEFKKFAHVQGFEVS